MLEPPKIPGVNFPEHIGNYRLVRELGRGSMGTVYLAYQESLGRDLALKVLAPEFTRDDEFVERFRREGKIAARLRHPHIVQVHRFGSTPQPCQTLNSGRPFFSTKRSSPGA